jgi:hypothetical protein
MNIDRTAIERAELERVKRAAAERIEFVYSRLFGNVGTTRAVESLRTENAAQELLKSAIRNADNPLQVAILRAAIDNRWTAVVTSFTKTWHEHPISATVQELWDLSRGRTAV